MGAFIGVDPGLSGAIAFYNSTDDILTVLDVPTFELKRGGKTKREVDVVGLAGLMREHAVAGATGWIEQVGSMPGQGVSSVFAFGKAVGCLWQVLACQQVAIEKVTPQVWKKALKVPAAKDGARARASELMPRHARNWTRGKDHNRAEAALIAYYGSQQGKA